MKKFNIRNVGGFDKDTETGNENTTLSPLFVIDYYDADGRVRSTSCTFQKYSVAEAAANERLAFERTRG